MLRDERGKDCNSLLPVGVDSVKQRNVDWDFIITIS